MTRACVTVQKGHTFGGEHEVAKLLLNSDAALTQCLSHVFGAERHHPPQVHEVIHCSLVKLAVLQHVPEKSAQQITGYSYILRH